MNILGISSFYFDSAACLMWDGEIIAAAQEERFTRNKRDGDFPINAIKYCLKEGGLEITDIDIVGFYDNSSQNVKKARSILKKMGCCKEIVAFSRHESYLASAFYPSPFDESAIIISANHMTGILGGRGTSSHIETFKYLRFSYSLSDLYSAITSYLGFNANSDEYKVMGLSAYGKPRYKDLLINKKEILSIKDLRKTQKILKNLLKVDPRKPGAEISQEHMDIASSAQAAVEEETIKIVDYMSSLKSTDALCLGGEMALNCLLNTKILREKLFKKIWIQPASTDAGCAVGAAFLVWHKYLENKKSACPPDLMKNAFLGPAYSDNEIEAFLSGQNIPFKRVDYAQIPGFTAELLASGNVIGWFQARMEFGPRALGSRSILADSRNLSMHDRLNLKVKYREPFRPLAPSVLQDKAGEYFELPQENPYMLFTAAVKEDKRSLIPAVTHIDGSSRVQTIKRDAHPLYYDTIYAFFQKTGCPVIVNTSFNTKNEPIVLSPKDAYNCFKSTDMDYLIMGNFVVDRSGK